MQRRDVTIEAAANFSVRRLRCSPRRDGQVARQKLVHASRLHYHLRARGRIEPRTRKPADPAEPGGRLEIPNRPRENCCYSHECMPVYVGAEHTRSGGANLGRCSMAFSLHRRLLGDAPARRSIPAVLAVIRGAAMCSPPTALRFAWGLLRTLQLIEEAFPKDNEDRRLGKHLPTKVSATRRV